MRDVEIFSLLPLEKFNLDKVKPDESKKVEEEKLHYRLIPRTFANSMQAFNILASVIEEKALENCSALFCYLDYISEAQRVYGGVAWLRYDEQFRQWKAVRPSLRWDHKDIGLWMKLMTQARVAPQPFHWGGPGVLRPLRRCPESARGSVGSSMKAIAASARDPVVFSMSVQAAGVPIPCPNA